MMNSIFSAVKSVVGDNETINQFREGVIENRFEDVQRIIDENGEDILDADLSVGKLGVLSNYTPSSWKGMHGENADSLEYRAIHWAARKGHLELLRYLCAKGANVNITNYIGNTALHVALYYKQKEAVKVLLEYKPKVDILNTGSLLASVTENFAPLHYAALYGDAECIVLLLKAGAAVDIKGLYGLMPLHFAATVGDIEKLSCFLSVQQDMNCVDSDGKTPLHHAVLASLINPCAVKAVLFLLESQANPNCVDNKNNTPLELLIKTINEQMLDITPEQLQVAQHLLTWGADRERFNACINETQGLNFSLELTYFLLNQCSQQKTQTLLLEKALSDTKNTPLINPDIPRISNSTPMIMSNTFTAPELKTPMGRGAPPPPPSNNAPRKKYRECTKEENAAVIKKPTATPTHDVMAELIKALAMMQRDINPSSSSSDEDEVKKLSSTPASKK